jgi:hypothetical protein
MKYVISVLFAMFFLSSVAWADFNGPISEYYVTDGDSNILSVVQGQSVVRSWQLQDNQYPIAVTSTVRAYASYNYNTGSEYTLAGVPTGKTYPFQGDAGQSLDGATDASRHNWLISFNDYAVWQFDRDWKNPTSLFTLSNSPTGITYDMRSGNLWIASDDGIIGRYTMSGTLLTSFEYGSERRVGSLAWEPATDTLWGIDNNTNQVLQWSKDGTLLQAGYVEGTLGGNSWGGEFAMAAVPLPPSLLLLAPGLLSLAGMRKRFSK